MPVTPLFSGIKIDNVEYDVRIRLDSMKRTFTLIEGKNSGTSLRYHKIRDLQGTGFSLEFDVEPNPNNRSSYNDFYDVISSPTESHTIELPFCLYSNVDEFEGYITTGTDVYGGLDSNGDVIWKGLKVQITYIEPTRLS